MDEQCFRCGVSESEERLFDVVYQEGIVKFCQNCAQFMNLPIIRRPTTHQLKNVDSKTSVYERLSKAAGIPMDKRSSGEKEKDKLRQNELEKQNFTLKDLIDKNLREKVRDTISSKRKIPPRVDLVDNFQWRIMMARKNKKKTTGLVAQEIGESETVVKMAEQGILPEDDYRLISKLETYFGIKLRKEGVIAGAVKKDLPKRIDFDPMTLKNITISDLRRMKEEKVKKKNEMSSKENQKIEKDVEDIGLDLRDKDIEQTEEGELDWAELRRKVAEGKK